MYSNCITNASVINMWYHPFPSLGNCFEGKILVTKFNFLFSSPPSPKHWPPPSILLLCTLPPKQWHYFTCSPEWFWRLCQYRALSQIDVRFPFPFQTYWRKTALSQFLYEDSVRLECDWSVSLEDLVQPPSLDTVFPSFQVCLYVLFRHVKWALLWLLFSGQNTVQGYCHLA